MTSASAKPGNGEHAVKRESSAVFDRLLRGEATPEEYVAALRREARAAVAALSEPQQPCLACEDGHGPDRAYGPDVYRDPCDLCGGSGVAASSDTDARPGRR